MKQLSQLFVLSSISFISASTSQDVLGQSAAQKAVSPDDALVDVPSKHDDHTPPYGVERRQASRSPAVEPRVYVQDEATGSLYYYDYPQQPSHAKQNPPKL